MTKAWILDSNKENLTQKLTQRKPMPDGSDRIPTNLRLLLILECVAEAGDALTAAEIGRRMDLPKQTIHRLCSTLLDEGFLVKEGGGKRLIPGRRARQTAAGVLYASPNHIIRRQILMRVSKAVEETVNFVVPRDEGMIYLDRVETEWPFRIQLPIGSNVPFHATASGKTFLASLPPRKRKAMVGAMDMQALTPKTHVNRQALLADLAEIARRGYALDDEEMMEGLVALAVPVTDEAGRFIAAIAFHGPIQRLSTERALSHLSVLQTAALEIRDALT